MKLLKILFLYCFGLISFEIYAQARPFSIFYNFAGSYNNPAAIGRAETIQGSVFYRHFFSNFAKSPNFMGLDVNVPFKNIYAGLTYLRNRNGYDERNEIALDVAYKLFLSNNFVHSLTFGLAPIFEIDSFFPVNAIIKDPNDPNFPVSARNRNYFKPNVRLGLDYIYKKFSFSFSIPYFLATTIQNNGTGENKVGFSIQRFNFFLGLAYDFQLIEDLVLQTRLNQRLDIQYDIDLLAMFQIKRILGIGLYYSTLDKIGLWI